MKRRTLRNDNSRTAAWLAWLFGAALLGAVIGSAVHFSEGREFVRLAAEAQPRWLLIAVILQLLTYVAQSEVWRAVGRAISKPLPLQPSLELSLAKLFIDQALPSAGISSSVLIVKALERDRLPQSAAKAVVALDILTRSVAYVLCLAASLGLSSRRIVTNSLVITTAVLFTLFSFGLIAGILWLGGRRPPSWLRRFERISPVRGVVHFLEDVDENLTRSVPLLLETTAYQLVIFACDVATLLVLIWSMGATASASGVFVSFMIASLFRTMGIVPGGLGTFEAASVLTLRLAGASTPVALAGTMLFRGLSFWLPMLPGLWASRRISKGF